MNINGRFRGNFIAVADKTIPSKTNTLFHYKIIKLINVEVINAKELDDSTYNEVFETSITIIDEKNQIAKIENSINVPFSNGFKRLNGIDPLRISNLKLENTKKVSKGYFFEFLKGIKILDSLLAICVNVFIFVPSLFYNKFKPVSDEIYFGKIEGDFIGKEPIINKQSNSEITQNMDPSLLNNTVDSIEPLLPADSV